MSNSATNATKSWFDFSTNGAGLQNRIAQINKYRSPHTRADEILRILQWIVQPLLIIYCTVLSFASYQAFFSHNFSPKIAALGAGLLCIVIEFGKISVGSYVFQKPFLEGLSWFRKSFPEVAVWFGAFLFALAAFIMSVINSTTGAHSLSLMKGTAKNEMAFVSNTADIDRQISDANARITANGQIKWKGTVTYQAQKAIERDTRTLNDLQRQKETATNIQRADFERTRAMNDQNTTTGANILMASGGWVELLQVICMFMIAACMSVVGSVMDKEKSPHPTANIGNATGYKATAPNPTTANNLASPDRQIGFFWKGYGDTSNTNQKTVPQSAFTVPQQNGNSEIASSDAVLKNCQQAIQRDLPNFLRKDSRAASVSQRINTALDETYTVMQKNSFHPSRDVAIKFFAYLQNSVFPTLNERGWPYEDDTVFINLLLSHIPKTSLTPHFPPG